MRATNRSDWTLPRFLRGLLHGPLAPEDAARRVSAFVYGDILVLAALVALDPEDLNGTKAVAYVVGTGVSTFVAHVLAESVGFRLRTDQRLTREHMRHELRDSLPIVSATAVPALLLGAVLPGWLDADQALLLAIAVTILRLASLGWVVAHLRQRRASISTLLSGVLLALAGIAAAALKWWLTH
jgi:hypothetical protein